VMINKHQTSNRKETAIFIVGVFLFFLFVFIPAPVKAATSTLRGWAWWGDTLQKVYFNCLDDVIGDRLDVDYNLDSLPVPRGFHFYSSPCQYTNHKVEINSQGNFSGKAWNPTKGFISFSGTTTPPDGYGSTSSNCPATCNSSNQCWACYDDTDQNVYGWAQVDDDGTWLKLDSALTPPVKIQSCGSSVWPGYGVQPGDFVGYATSSLGDLSFNCKSELGGEMCATRDYKVVIGNLTVGNLSAPNWPYSEACNSTALGATLRWCKKSGTQTAYEVIVSSTNSTTTPICYSGKKYSTNATQYNLPNLDPTCSSLNYDSAYYWWVQLYDEYDQPTGWYQYNTNSGSDTDNNLDGLNLTFQTYKHEFPSPYFTWSPYEVLVGTSTLFSATSSQYYTNLNPNTPNYCSGANCTYLWTVLNDPGSTITPDDEATTSIVFSLAASTTINLVVTDSIGYYCSTSTIIRINYGLPIWREIKAR